MCYQNPSSSGTHPAWICRRIPWLRHILTVWVCGRAQATTCFAGRRGGKTGPERTRRAIPGRDASTRQHRRQGTKKAEGDCYEL